MTSTAEQPIASPSPNSVLSPNPPKAKMAAMVAPMPLTGAAAMEDNRQEQARKRASAPSRSKSRSPTSKDDGGGLDHSEAMTSPNPAANAKAALAGASSQPVSKPIDAPVPPSITTNPILPSITTSAPTVEEPMQIDEGSSTPVVTSPTEMGTHGDINGTSLGQGTRKRPLSPHNDERSTKAFTYPPPQNLSDAETPPSSRHMSLPNSNTKPGSNKKHRCIHCQTEFTRHHNLKSHLLTHSQEKPFGCDQCTAKFRRLHDLKRHIKLHTGERNHECTKCHRRFARGDALARHMKGPEGCAGRRGSATGPGDDDQGDSVDNSLNDAEHDATSPEDDQHRRRSEPGRPPLRSLTQNNDSSPTSYSHASTYPPVAPMSQATMYPPVTAASSSNSYRGSQQHLSPHPYGGSYPGVQFSGPTMYSHAGMTESPKPLSPGSRDVPNNQIDPAITRYSQPQNVGRNGSHSEPMAPLPAPHPANPQLPSLPSIRNGSVPNSAAEDSYMSHIRSMERKMKEMEDYYQGQINRLQDELRNAQQPQRR